jgi:hypothetical protein
MLLVLQVLSQQQGVRKGRGSQQGQGPQQRLVRRRS